MHRTVSQTQLTSLIFGYNHGIYVMLNDNKSACLQNPARIDILFLDLLEEQKHFLDPGVHCCSIKRRKKDNCAMRKTIETFLSNHHFRNLIRTLHIFYIIESNRWIFNKSLIDLLIFLIIYLENANFSHLEKNFFRCICLKFSHSSWQGIEFSTVVDE